MEDGTYKIGRDPAADIVLDSKTISKSHATLVIDKDSFQVIDNGSSNGIYCREEKISAKEFKNAFQIELAPFTIRTAAAAKDEPAPAGKTAVLPDAIGFFVNSNIRIALFAVIALGMLLTLLIVYIPLKSSAKSLSRQEHLKKGKILSRYLGEMNRPFLERADNTLVRTAPVQDEDGVLYAFVVDGRGRIMAPPELRGDFFNWDGLSKALTDARQIVDKGPRGENLIFSPITSQDQTLGAAIIGFSAEKDKSARGVGMGAAAVLLLLILFGLSLIVSYLLAKNFLTPLKLFHEEVEVAIKEGRDHIKFYAPYEELDNLKLIVNRLLLRKTADSSPPDPLKAEPSVKSSRLPENDPAQVKAKTNPAEKNQSRPVTDEHVAAPSGPWCLVDMESYTLAQFSDTFTRDLGLKECRKGMHIIEAFDSDIIVIVTQIIEKPDGKTLETDIAGKKYRVFRKNQNTDKASILIVFEEIGP